MEIIWKYWDTKNKGVHRWLSVNMGSQYFVKWKKQVIKEHSMISHLFLKTIRVYVYIEKNTEEVLP